MDDLSAHDKEVLSRIGRGAYGKELVAILQKVRRKNLSLEGVDVSREIDAQVQGRLIFKVFADEIIASLSFQPQHPHPLERDDYE